MYIWNYNYTLFELINQISLSADQLLIYIYIYSTLLCLHTITVLPLTTVYIVSEVHCISSVLYSVTL